MPKSISNFRYKRFILISFSLIHLQSFQISFCLNINLFLTFSFLAFVLSFCKKNLVTFFNHSHLITPVKHCQHFFKIFYFNQFNMLPILLCSNNSVNTLGAYFLFSIPLIALLVFPLAI